MLRDEPSLRGQELLDAVTQTVQSAHHGFFLSGAAAIWPTARSSSASAEPDTDPELACRSGAWMGGGARIDGDPAGFGESRALGEVFLAVRDALRS